MPDAATRAAELDARKALACLLVAVEAEIAMDVSTKVYAWINELREENERLRHIINPGDAAAHAEYQAHLEEENARLWKAGSKVCEGFDKGVFVRSTKGDDNSGWSLLLMPYIQALAALAPAPPSEDDDD